MCVNTLKHCIKVAIGRSDPLWPLFKFEKKVHPDTWKKHQQILTKAEQCLVKKDIYEKPEFYEKSDDPLVRQGYALKQKTEKKFKDLFANKRNIRLLVHIPDPLRSPAGFSLFTNFAEAFEFIGIPVKILNWGESTQEVLDDFKPTIFLSSDHSTWLEKIDWEAVAKYRSKHQLRVALTAGLAEYINTPLLERLDWAKKHHIDFYYSYRDPDYIHARKEYQPFFDKNYKIIFLSFGANILRYYPVPGFIRDIPYAFLASTNRAKAPRYIEYLQSIVSKYSGFIDGPGWQKVRDFNFNRSRDRYIYARSKIGLNLHLKEQIDLACEVNERTFMLAACGVPQITDDAKLLSKLFSKNALFVAKNPKEYQSYFEMILKNPHIGIERALVAQREVFEKHTTFHRAEAFIKQLMENNLAS